MKSFFQDIVFEREKRNAGKNYVIEGVRVLNEARFRSSDEVISAVSKRYPEDQASVVLRSGSRLIRQSGGYPIRNSFESSIRISVGWRMNPDNKRI